MRFDVRGWMRQPSTILGFGTVAGLFAAAAARYEGGTVSGIVAAGGLVFALVHMLLPDNTQAAADAQALAIDVVKGVANHTIEVQIPQILRDALQFIKDAAAKSPPSNANVAGDTAALGATSAVDRNNPVLAPALKVAAALFFALTMTGVLMACTQSEQVTALQASSSIAPCMLAIQAKVASEPTATDEQKGLDAANVAATNASCVALGTDTATLVQEATAPATTAPATTAPATPAAATPAATSP